MPGLEAPTSGEIIAAASIERDLLAPSPEPLSASSSKPPITPYRPPGPGSGTGVHRYSEKCYVKIPSSFLTVYPSLFALSGAR